MGNSTVPSNVHELDSLKKRVAELEHLLRDKQRELDSLSSECSAYKSVFELNPFATTIFDNEGYHMKSNRASVNIFNGEPPPTYNIFNEPLIKDEQSLRNLREVRDGKRNKFKFSAWYNTGKIVDELPDKDIFIEGYIFAFDNDNNKKNYISVVSDNTKKKVLEKDLMESEERYRSIWENVNIGIYRTTPDGQILLANPGCYKMLGYESLEELKEMNVEYNGYYQPEMRKNFKKMMEDKGEVLGYESAWVSKDGKVRYIRESSKAYKDFHGNILYYEGTVENITDKKLADKALSVSEERFRKLIEDSFFGFTIIQDEKFIYVNKAICDIIGYTEEELLNFDMHEWIDIVHPDDREKVYNRIMGRYKGEIYDSPLELRFVSRKGDIKWVEASSSIVYIDDKPALQSAHNEITQRKLNEILLQESLNEKEILLREIHHRVKNNLQLMMSLLEIQKSKQKEPALINILEETRARIRSIALIHEKMYQSENFREIDCNDYIREIIKSLIQTYSFSSEKIRFNINLEGLFLSLNKAITFAIIINELVSNSLKYAFAGQSDGEIVVKADVINDNIFLKIYDNGIGLPEGVNIDNPDSFGLLLVKILVKQLKGKLKLDTNAGTVYTIEFDKKYLGDNN